MKKPMGCAALIAETVREQRDWVTRCEDIKVRELTDLRSEMAIGDFDSIKTLNISLDLLALYYGKRGAVSVIDGTPTGWLNVDLAVKYQYWNLSFESALALMQTRPNHPERFNPAKALIHETPILPSLICYAIVHDLDAMRDELWRAFQAVLRTREAVTDCYWTPRREGRYELFAFRMFAATPWGGGVELPVEHCDYSLGPYASLLDAWERPGTLAEPLRAVCDYHCANLRADNVDDLAPFESPPFGLVPYDILAVYKIREQLGLATPEIDHPLMKLPTASLAPRQVHQIEDPLFPQLEALFNKHCQPFWNETLGL